MSKFSALKILIFNINSESQQRIHPALTSSKSLK
jgi:hypothetical protein